MTPTFESRPLLIGKHEWRVIVRPSYLGGFCLEYQWRPAPLPGSPEEWPEQWKGERQWPGWNGDDTYCGLPKTLRRLYDRERAALAYHLHGQNPPPDPQASLDL